MSDTETISEPDYQTLEGLKAHPLWQMLTGKQATFLEQYILTGSKVDAAFAAYDTPNRAGAHALAAKALHTYEVKQLLALYRGYSIRGTHVTRSELLSLISERLRSETLSITEFRNLSSVYADIKGWRPTKQKRGTKLLDKDPEELTDAKELMQLVQQYEQQQGNTKARAPRAHRSEDEEDEQEEQS